MSRICFISPSLHQGGLENAVTVLANEISNRGHEVAIICIYNNPIFYELNKSIQVILPSYNRREYSTLPYYWKSVKFIRHHIKSLKPDVLISYGDFVNPISIMATRGLRIPIFVSDRSSPEKKFPFLVRKMRKYCYPFAEGIIAQTNRAKQQKIEMLGKNYTNIKVLPNPIRPIIEYADIDRENIILGVGRHYKVKGLDRLIKAFGNLSATDWKLVIAGSRGPQTKELEKLVKELRLEDRVEFLGAVKEMDKIYKQAKIFVLPSRSEGFPNALIEAMANGLACISFDIIAGPREIIRNDINGLLIEDGNIESLSSSIENLIGNEELRNSLGREALKLKDELSTESIANSFLEFIKA